MNEIKVFENKDMNVSVRTIVISEEVWFVASDICKALEVSNTTQAVQRLDDDEKSMLNIGLSGGATNCVNEYGLYNLVLASRKKEAKDFKRWITHKVLPSIRKNGGYITGQEEMTPEQIVANALIVANNIIANKDKQIAEMQPKAEYFDELVERNLLTSFRVTANEFGIKEGVLINWLIEKKYIYRDQKNKLRAYADKNNGLFETKEYKSKYSDHAGTQTLITPKGRETFRILMKI